MDNIVHHSFLFLLNDWIMKLSRTKQIALLRDLRRKCAFCYREGPHGYVCRYNFKVPNGPYTSRLPIQCNLACERLAHSAWLMNVDITVDNKILQAI